MTQTLELSEIQATALRHRPMPYYGAYVFMRINDPEHTPTLLSRLIPKITTSAEWQKPVDESWLNIVFTYTGLARPRLPQAILDGFPQEFRVPMSERKQYLGDIGESDPANWDCPFGRSELHTEFLQSQWVNDGDFVSAGHDKAPIEGDHPKDSQFMFSAAPVRRRLARLPTFVVTKGGEHVFLPGIGGLRWLAEGRW